MTLLITKEDAKGLILEARANIHVCIQTKRKLKKAIRMLANSWASVQELPEEE